MRVILALGILYRTYSIHIIRLFKKKQKNVLNNFSDSADRSFCCLLAIKLFIYDSTTTFLLCTDRPSIQGTDSPGRVKDQFGAFQGR